MLAAAELTTGKERLKRCLAAVRWPPLPVVVPPCRRGLPRAPTRLPAAFCKSASRGHDGSYDRRSYGYEWGTPHECWRDRSFQGRCF
jgi:hypothetical protein